MAEARDDLKELRLKITELENQLRQFMEPPELSDDEVKAYKKVKAAVEFGAAAAACRGCMMLNESVYSGAAAAACRGCMMLNESVYSPAAAACRGCMMLNESVYSPAAAACRGCMMLNESVYSGAAAACRGCAGPCMAGSGAPGPRVGRGSVARFAGLGE